MVLSLQNSNMKQAFWLLLLLPLLCTSLNAQLRVEFRIHGIASNLDDMDGFGASDPQWNYEIDDNLSGGFDDNDSKELGGTNCPGSRSHIDQFFSEEYDCHLPSSFDFVFRGFEDDGLGSDANTGDKTFAVPTAAWSTTTSSTWKNVFGGSGYVQARASGDDCSASLPTPIQSQGSGSVRYLIRLQYRVLGSPLCKDECNDPYVLPTAGQYNCGPSQPTTSLNERIKAREPADASENSHTTAGITCTIDGSSPEDIWVRTTIPAESGGVEIQFENNGGCTGALCFTNVTYAWYTSSNGTCSGLEYRGCGDVSCFFGCSDGKIKVDGRANEEVWVRIWEEDDQGFDIEINQIKPTAPADKCYTAMPLSQLGCNYGATAPTSGPYAEPDNAAWTAPAHPGGVCQDGDSNPATSTIWGSNENLVWYTFTQLATSDFNIAVDNMNCTGGAGTAQLGVYTNSGGAASPTCDLATETGMGCSVGVGAVQLSISNLPAGDYLLVIDGNSGAECQWEFKEFVGGNLLPIDFKEFKGTYDKQQDNIALNWTMPTSNSIVGFEVQRSIDGIAFNKIGFVDAKDFADDSHTEDVRYAYTDNSYPSADVLYYRLVESDVRGTSMLSNTIAVTPVKHDAGVSVLQEIYPNPAHEKLTIPFITTQDDVVSIKLYDVQGREVMTMADNMAYPAGRHKIVAYLSSELPNGLYVLRFVAGNKAVTRKIMLNRRP